MASHVTDSVQGAGSQAKDTASKGTEKWDAMSEEQKKQTFDKLPEDKKQGKSYTEWIMDGYHHQYENWMPWIEDQYLKWFTNHNKTSYTAKQNLDSTKVTGVEQVDNLQDGVNNTVAGTVGQGGILQPVGDMMSKEGVNRAERGGKDNSGSYGGAAADSVVNNAKSAGNSASSGAKGAGSYVSDSAKSAGGYVSGLFGGGKDTQKQ